MSLGELFRVAMRYTLAFGRGHLSVFMAGVSMTGLILATALLLTVLSVMNGFEREMRERILALVPHVTVHTPGDGGRQSGIDAAFDTLPGLVEARPFVSFYGMAVRGNSAMAVSGIGLDALPAGLPLTGADGEALTLDGLLLGDSVARRLGVTAGDALTLFVSSTGAYRQAAVETKRVTVAAVVDTGTEIDEALALLPLEDAASLAGISGRISGWRLRFVDPFAVDARLDALRRLLPPGSYATTWRMTHGNLHAAIQLSRDLVVLLLASIIGVAAFNVVSALALVVIDQRSSIAILRTLGASPAAMGVLFLIQGGIIGVIGAGIGCALGVLLSSVLPGAIATIERLAGFQFLATDVYPVSFVPVDLRATDAALIAFVSVLMCVLAAVYPALRAARLPPATVLQTETG
ncbi:MAG: FtsX-like permease family protein [Pseudomonadota bacterium]